MRFIRRLAVYFYVLTISLISGVAILFVTRTIPIEDINYYLQIAYTSDDVRLVIGLAASALILISFILERIIADYQQKERTIAFDNPAGRVLISLYAVEDLVRRVLYKIPEIKDVKPKIVATKRGIEISVRLILKADVNIPDLTLKLQELIKNKIQEILGVDETVIVRIHVVKIVGEETRPKRKEDAQEKTETAPIPFQGYRQ